MSATTLTRAVSFLRERKLSRPGRLALLAILILLLSACKIRVVVPPGGSVVSANGLVCLPGSTCVIDVSDESYDDTFTATPAPGYVFKAWKKKPGYFCGGKSDACRLFTTAFNGDSTLLDILASDQAFFLRPIFVSTAGYKLSYWKKLMLEIDKGSFTSDSFLYSLQPNVATCNAGVLSNPARQRALLAVNNIRALHKLPAVDYDTSFDSEVQEAGLVQNANNYINHFPAPADLCYSTAAENASSTSNLGAAQRAVDPAADVIGWTNDKNNVAALEEAGHRRWILSPELGYLAYGQVEGFSALKVFGFDQPPMRQINANIKFVAFPYQSYPWVLVSNGDTPTPWSISMVPPAGMSDSFDYFAKATVSVKTTDSGKMLPVHTIHHDTKGFGLANFLSWQVEDWAYDTAYKVTISGVKKPEGGTRTISYEVLLDRFNLFNVKHPLESSDALEGATMQGMFDSDKDVDSYIVSLRGKQSFSGNSEFSNQAFFVRIYDSRKQLLKSSDVAFEENFPAGKYSVLISPCDESGLCFLNVKTYTVNFE